jgi:arylsulfatase A-like enzyme
MRALLTVLSLFSTSAAVALPAERPPNILLIAVDDMNDWIGAMQGVAQTPHIDRLAARGMLFDNAYCVTPACNPSRVALLTGLRPETTGQHENAGNFRHLPGNEQLLTLPQRLQQAGYRTIAAGKVFHHPRGPGPQPAELSDPISWTEQWRGRGGTGGHEPYLIANNEARWLQGVPHEITNDYGRHWAAVWGPIPDLAEETGDWRVAQYCADVLRQEHEQPFFLACGIFRPHAPLLAPQKYFDRFPLDQVELPKIPADDMNDIPAIAQRNWSTPLFEAMKREDQWRLAVQAYLACMAYADDCVGVVLDALERSPHRDNTIVVFLTDHGWQLGHKQRWEKFSLWRQATRAPLVIQAPGQKPGRCSRAVSFLDLAPTLLELTGLAVPKPLEGESLVPWLGDPRLPRERPAVITYLPGNHSVVHENWNYIRYQDGAEELYDHQSDPGEYTNLIGRQALAPLVRRLRGWLP